MQGTPHNDIEIVTRIESSNESRHEASNEKNSISTVQRIRYEAEVDYIIKKFGTLDQMREKLGVTRRKMCEILLVDPSAWTRWTTSQNGTDSAPAHVYKTMSLILQNAGNRLDKNIENFTEKLAAQNDFRSVKNEINNYIQKSKGTIHSDIEDKVRQILESYAVDLESRVNSHNEKMDSFIRSKTELSLGWKILILMNLAALIFFFVF
jgi:hypothetical protein